MSWMELEDIGHKQHCPCRAKSFEARLANDNREACGPRRNVLGIAPTAYDLTIFYTHRIAMRNQRNPAYANADAFPGF